MKKDIMQDITNRVIEQLEQGIIPWERPWAGVRDGAISHATGRAYSFCNQLFMKPGEYLTWNQVHQEGGRVKAGARSSSVIFWKRIAYQAVDEDGQPRFDDDGNAVVGRVIPYLRDFTVFHIDDCENVAPRWDDKLADTKDDLDADRVLRDYVRREGIHLEITRSNEAYYDRAFDRIHLPLLKQFKTASDFYATAFHEATHSTGHYTRLNRLKADSHFGNESYSREELVAEMGSACIMNELGLENTKTFRNTSAYIQSWLRALRNDRTLIAIAASQAEKAARLILNLPSEKDGETA